MPAQQQQRAGGRYLARSMVFLIALVALAVLFLPTLRDGFLANVYLNGTILAIFAFGVLYTLKALIDTFLDTRAANRVVSVADAVRRGDQTTAQATEVMLAPNQRAVGAFLGTVHRVVHHGATSATLPYLLDSLGARGEDRRALVRYLTGALVLLGLIGTFFGLLLTIGGVRDVIGNLAAEPSTDTVQLLAGLKEDLAQPLNGMALAFSSSLFGLLTSLALAFLELQLFHAQNDLQARLESLVVSDLVPLWQPHAAAPASGETAAAPPRYLAGLLGATVERLDRLAGLLEAGQNRGEGVHRVAEQAALLGERIESLRATLEGAERERTAELRQELRTLGHVLARREEQREEVKHAPPA